MKLLIKTLALLLLLSNFSYAQSLTTRIDSIVNAYSIDNPEIGISVGFIHNNNEYYTAYGNLNRKSDIEINKNSIFELVSITKIITSNLIAQAALEGKLNVYDYIDNYLPKDYELNKNIQQKIKISDLASHQSGLPDLDFKQLIQDNPQQPTDIVDQKYLSNIINNCDELIDYGTYRYSTISYVLLGQILETVYSKSYDKILRMKIIDPLQLTNTLTKDFDVHNITGSYNPEGGEQELFNWNRSAPAGLIKSSASDIITYLKAILDSETSVGKGSVLSESIYYKDERREMGLGLYISTDEQNTIYLKTGDSLGQSSLICYNREKNWGIIIQLNQRNSKLVLQILNDIYTLALY